VIQSIQRMCAEFTIENTVSVFPLESDDLKGQIIGREGRNIRAIEAATGAEIVVDDTPEAIVISSFDPIRREVCRLSLKRLVADGRIHPARGLLHDIGKVAEEETELSHAILGMKLCEKHNESDIVSNAVGAHHDEVEMTNMVSPIVQACDAISGARPGARREILESYMKRIGELETIAMSHDGVQKAYAMINFNFPQYQEFSLIIFMVFIQFFLLLYKDFYPEIFKTSVISFFPISTSTTQKST